MTADPFSPNERSEVMSAVGSEDTAVEMRLRRALWHSGLRYTVHEQVAGTKPDIVFTGAKVAIFVDGCFWHGCPDHYTAPENNAAYWRKKLERNRERDRRNNCSLREAGWTVLCFWECEVNEELTRVFSEIEATVNTPDAEGDAGE